jgi:hypothetical protein
MAINAVFRDLLYNAKIFQPDIPESSDIEIREPELPTGYSRNI